MQLGQNEVKEYLMLVILKLCLRPILTKSGPHAERGVTANLAQTPGPVVSPHWKFEIAHDFSMDSSLV